MGVVSFRIRDEDEETLRRAGVNPGALAKKAVEDEARRAEAAFVMSELAKYRRKPEKSVVDMIREDRSRDDRR